MCAYLICIDLYQREVSFRVPWTCSLLRDFRMSILQTRCEMYWKVVIVGWSVEYTHETFPRRNFVSCLVEPVDPVIGVWESPYRNSFFWIFFSPIYLGWWGDIFGSEESKKFWPHMGFSSKLFFQNSSIFSNNSYRWSSWSVHWPQGVYILNIIGDCDVMTSDWKKFFGLFHFIDQFPKHIQFSTDKLQ